MESTPVKRRRTKGIYSLKEFRTKYYAFNRKKERVPVCYKAFVDITRVGKSRLFLLANKFNQRRVLDDRRGGFKAAAKYNEQADSIVAFINSLNFVESHYCRGRSERKYLPSELNINQLYRMYNEKQRGTELLNQVKASYFRFIFNTRFNIGFKMPQTDVCSTCLSYKERIKHCPKGKIL